MVEIKNMMYYNLCLEYESIADTNSSLGAVT